MKKIIKKSIMSFVLILCLLAPSLTSLASSGVVNGNLPASIKLPTIQDAMVNGEAVRNIVASKEESKVKPWVFANVKLEQVRSLDEKLNYCSLALNRAIAYFQDHHQHLKNNDYFIVLNNGFVIDKDNYTSKKVYEEAKKQFQDEELYQGDTLFTIAFLSGEHRVVKKSEWRLVDIINLAAGSGHTTTTTITTGITAMDNVTLSETLGFKLVDTLGGSFGIDKVIKANLNGSLTNEINKNTSRSFSTSNTVMNSANETITVKHGSGSKRTFVLRYQLVDNYNVNQSIFDSVTKDLLANMNMGGRKIVSLEPACGKTGVDVPSNIVFDVIEQS